MADNEELVDYEEDEVIAPEVKSEAVSELTAEGEKDKKGSYVGIHSTGFRSVLLASPFSSSSSSSS